MLEGGASTSWASHGTPSKAGDFIWMAPYCPSGLARWASCREISHLKDWRRHPLGA